MPDGRRRAGRRDRAMLLVGDAGLRRAEAARFEVWTPKAHDPSRFFRA
jgi:hypothetical protein